VEWRVAHSSPGRLRLRAADRRLASLASPKHQLDGMAGLRAVELRPRTGSLIIEYDPVACTEDTLVAALVGDRPPLDEPPPPADDPGPRHGVLLSVATAGAAVAASLLPVPTGVTAGLVLLSGLPILCRASRSLARGPRLNVDTLDAISFAVLLARRNF